MDELMDILEDLELFVELETEKEEDDMELLNSIYDFYAGFNDLQDIIYILQTYKSGVKLDAANELKEHAAA